MRLIGQSDLSLLVLSADAPWSSADEGVLKRYQQAARRPVQVVLNQAEPDRLAGLLDPLPKRKKGKRAKKTTQLQPQLAEPA